MLDRLKSFVMIGDLHSVSLAARKLYLTQPALTQHIRFLENHFDKKLIYRSGNAMELTPEGERLHLAARDLLKKSEELNEIFVSNKAKKRSLRFSAIDSTTETIVPYAIKKLLKKHKNIRLIPDIYSSTIAASNLLKESLDLSVCVTDFLPAELGKEVLMTEPFVFIGNKDHSNLTKIRDLEKEDFIIFPQAAMTRRLMDEMFRNMKLAPNIVVETIKASAIVSFVHAGMGVSVVPYYSVYQDLKSKRVYQIPIKTKTKRTIGIAYKRGKMLPVEALEFIKYLREASQKISGITRSESK